MEIKDSPIYPGNRKEHKFTYSNSQNFIIILNPLELWLMYEELKDHFDKISADNEAMKQESAEDVNGFRD